ncbi:1-phosphofructokinase family hexose kinase [Nocardioides ultimimeridianus]
MILTVTPNPSIDRTAVLPGRLERGAVHRAEAVLFQPGGKGVNISRACVAAGVPTLAVFPAAADDPFVAELGGLGVECRPVRPAGPLRINLTLTEPDGTTTKVNTSGATVTAEDLQRLTDATLAAVEERRPGWVVLAGSLPPGAPADWYAGLTARLRALGPRVAVDTSDAPLEATVAAADVRTGPTLLKPNAEELAAVTGTDEATLEGDPLATARTARLLLDRGVEVVLATLGASGAVLVDRTGAWHASPPPIKVVSTVGAGDASLFGYLTADLSGGTPEQRLASAVAYGAAAAGLAGTTPPTHHDVRTELVRVTRLDVPADNSDGGSATWKH